MPQKVADKKTFTLEEFCKNFKYHKNPILHVILKYLTYYKNCFLNVKWVSKNRLQQLVRGYSDSDCWNLPQATAKFMLPRIIHLRKNYHSLANRNHLILKDGNIIPYKPNKKDLIFKNGKVIDKNNKKNISLNPKEYEQVLDEIIFALQFMKDEDDLSIDLYEKYKVNPDGKNSMIFKETQRADEKFFEIEFKGPKPDFSKLNAAHERQRKGFILLGLYFKDLWD